MQTQASFLLDVEYEKRTIEAAKKMLQDIPACADAEYSVKFLNGAPLLVLAFNLVETLNQPAVAVRLVTISQSQPMQDGIRLEGDRLRRHIRDSVEHYLAKHGVRVCTFEC